MKKLFFAAAFIAASLVSKAGSDVKKISVGAEAGSLSYAGQSSFGVGASGKYFYDLGNDNGITGSLGFMSFKDLTLIPIKAGYRRLLGEKYYGEAQLGYTKYTINGASGGAITYAGNVGMILNEKIDLSIRYETLSDQGGSIGLLGLRAAYCF